MTGVTSGLETPAASTGESGRERLAEMLLRLWRPLVRRFSPGCARVNLGDSGAHFSTAECEFEGFARPLWGIVPFIAGGGRFPDWELFLTGIRNGTDPDHPEYWGDPAEYRHLAVDMPAIGLALALIPAHVWSPLASREQTRLVRWLRRIDTAELYDNNWLFFRVLVNLGLRNVGAAWDPAGVRAALDRLDTFYLGDGWYVDGCNKWIDYYTAYTFQLYSLLYVRLSPEDSERCERYRQRASRFARQFSAWFAGDGTAVPFGRSLTYRFAQGAFWGALGFADVGALDWGVVKGLLLRNLRWWFGRPIFHADGTLAVGYGYPNLNAVEKYAAAASPYWATKSFLPLALQPSHPFWTAPEADLPAAAEVTWEKHPKVAMFHTDSGRHVVMLNGGQSEGRIRGREAKYAKLAYSSHFAFNVPVDTGPAGGAALDSALTFCQPSRGQAGRDSILEARVDRHFIYARWQPFPGIEVETWLIPAPPWQVRVHRAVLSGDATVIEGGFAAPTSGPPPPARLSATPARAFVSAPGAGAVGLLDLLGERTALIVPAAPESNVQHPSTCVPVLVGAYTPGVLCLITAVLAVLDPADFEAAWSAPPLASWAPSGPRIQAGKVDVLIGFSGGLPAPATESRRLPPPLDYFR
jgi:hypothetical protein